MASTTTHSRRRSAAPIVPTQLLAVAAFIDGGHSTYVRGRLQAALRDTDGMLRRCNDRDVEANEAVDITLNRATETDAYRSAVKSAGDDTEIHSVAADTGEGGFWLGLAMGYRVFTGKVGLDRAAHAGRQVQSQARR